MKVIFYDRKHKCEVSNDQLMEINLLEFYISTDEDQPSKPVDIRELYTKEKQIGSIGYLSPGAGSGRNWDRWLNIEDLIFLRLEE